MLIYLSWQVFHWIPGGDQLVGLLLVCADHTALKIGEGERAAVRIGARSGKAEAVERHVFTRACELVREPGGGAGDLAIRSGVTGSRSLGAAVGAACDVSLELQLETAAARAQLALDELLPLVADLTLALRRLRVGFGRNVRVFDHQRHVDARRMCIADARDQVVHREGAAARVGAGAGEAELFEGDIATAARELPCEAGLRALDGAVALVGVTAVIAHDGVVAADLSLVNRGGEAAGLAADRRLAGDLGARLAD